MIYSKYYDMIDTNKYEIKEDGIYSKCFKQKIKGYKIGNCKKYIQTKLLCTDGKIHSLYLHCALWIHFNGNIPENMEINHIDGNQENNCLSNLELVTHKENMNRSGAQERKAFSIRNSEKIKKRRLHLNSK